MGFQPGQSGNIAGRPPKGYGTQGRLRAGDIKSAKNVNGLDLIASIAACARFAVATRLQAAINLAQWQNLKPSEKVGRDLGLPEPTTVEQATANLARIATEAAADRITPAWPVISPTCNSGSSTPGLVRTSRPASSGWRRRSSDFAHQSRSWSKVRSGSCRASRTSSSHRARCRSRTAARATVSPGREVRQPAQSDRGPRGPAPHRAPADQGHRRDAPPAAEPAKPNPGGRELAEQAAAFRRARRAAGEPTDAAGASTPATPAGSVGAPAPKFDQGLAPVPRRAPYRSRRRDLP